MFALMIAVILGAPDTTLPPYKLEEVIVTATRIYQSIRDVPIATTVITREQIESGSAKDVSEVIRGVAGVDIKSYGTTGSMSSVSLRGSTSQQVLVLVDGKPINSVSDGSADLSKLPLNNVEKIEIVRGPTSYLYGANAMGGVVNIITKEPPEHISTRLYGSYGTFNTSLYGIEQGGKFSNFSYLTSGEMKKSDGFRDNSDYEATDLFAKLGYYISSKLLAKVNFLYHSDEAGLPGSVPPEDSPAKYGSEKVTSLFDRMKDSNISSEFNFIWKPTLLSSLLFKNYYDHNKMDYITRYDDWWNWPPHTIDEKDKYITEIIGSSLQYQFDFAKHSVVVGGADIRKPKYNVTQEMVDINTGKDSVSKWAQENTEYGVWLEGQKKVLNLLKVTSGVRYDQHSEYGSEISPSLGVVYYFGSNDVLRVSWGKAYRAPSFNDLYWPTGGNPDLKPEKSWSFETGLKHNFLNTLTVDISVFTRETKNKIAWAPDTGGNWAPQNVNKHSCIGSEFEVKGKFNDRLQVAFTYTYLNAEQTNKEIVYSDWITGEIRQELKTRIAAFTPAHEVGANATFKPAIGTQLNFGARFVDKRINYYPNYNNVPVVTMDTKTLKSHTVIDGKLTQTIIRNLKLSVGINNILDMDYMEQFGTTFNDRGYPMPGRNYTLVMNWSL